MADKRRLFKERRIISWDERSAILFFGRFMEKKLREREERIEEIDLAFRDPKEFPDGVCT
ncbi:TPA: hypothetical protein EYP27_06450 [Candidatus Bathyarchaeota archaeon]|nr:hypothetical protein [Candidatus Bathyarchaeota archaeon]